jgi:error-prone DNA polymerase
VPVLERTLGVPLFQEQAMKLAMVAAKFTPNQANGLRRAMATFRNLGTIHNFRDQFIGNMIARGYTSEFAENCFKQIEGFGEYGFPESHAAAFAQLVYVSAWIKHFHPAAFGCALLNAQPMGFYAPAEIVRDAREHGVEVRPVDVSYSRWDSTLERDNNGALALRLGFRQVDGFKEEWAKALRLLPRETGEVACDAQAAQDGGGESIPGIPPPQVRSPSPARRCAGEEPHPSPPFPIAFPSAR